MKKATLALCLSILFSLAACGDAAPRPGKAQQIGQEIESVGLSDEKVNVLKLGAICHFIEEEKQSVPYRWRYYISDESMMGVYTDEYMDDSGSNPLPGGDKGWRRLYFEARAPGECVITLRYEDVRDGEYFTEYIYDIVINEEGII